MTLGVCAPERIGTRAVMGAPMRDRVVEMSRSRQARLGVVIGLASILAALASPSSAQTPRRDVSQSLSGYYEIEMDRGSQSSISTRGCLLPIFAPRQAVGAPGRERNSGVVHTTLNVEWFPAADAFTVRGGGPLAPIAGTYRQTSQSVPDFWADQSGQSGVEGRPEFHRLPGTPAEEEPLYFAMAEDNSHAWYSDEGRPFWFDPAPPADPASYSEMTREEFLAGGWGKPTYYGPALVRTADIPAIEQFFAEMGDGAQLLDAKLAECGSRTLVVNWRLPLSLEKWYIAQLRKKGLLLASARPLWRDPRGAEWSSLFVASVQITNAFSNARYSLGQRKQLMGRYLELALKRFAQARRPDFLQRGSVNLRTSAPPNIWVFELSGPALAACGNRWERLKLNFLFVGGGGRNKPELDVQVAEGNFAPGVGKPTESRLAENKIDDTALNRFQDLMMGFMMTAGFEEGEGVGTLPNRRVSC